MPLIRIKETPPLSAAKACTHQCWLSAHQVWAESIHWFGLQRFPTDFVMVCVITPWHVAPEPIRPQLAPSSFRRYGGKTMVPIAEYSRNIPRNIRPSRSDQPLGSREAKMLGHTDTCTHRQTSAGLLFIQRFSRRNLRAKSFNVNPRPGMSSELRAMEGGGGQNLPSPCQLSSYEG